MNPTSTPGHAMGDFQVGVGLSQVADTREAAQESIGKALAQAGLEEAQWALAFFSSHHMQGADTLRERLTTQTRCSALCGCSAMGVIAEGREVEQGPALAVMVGGGEGWEAHSAVLPPDGEGMAGFGSLGKWVDASPLIIALPDSYQVDPLALTRRMESDLKGVPVFGAGATDNGTVGIALQIGMEGVRNNSTAMLGLYGAFEVGVGITQSCTPLGEPHFITESRENLLIALDGKSALEAFIAQGQALELESFQELAAQVMFGFPLDPLSPEFTGETCLVRSISGMDQESHGLMVPFAVQSQTTMAFMHRNPEKAEQDMARMVDDAARQLQGPPDFGIYFDCTARGSSLYGKNGVDSAKIEARFPGLPLLGMFGGFELATALGLPHVYTYTGVLVLVRRRD